MKKLLKTFYIIFIMLFFSNTIIGATNEEIREQAKILYMGNETAKAIERIEQIPEKERNFNDYFLIGLFSDDFTKSITAYKKAIELNKEAYQAYYNLGIKYSEVKNYEQAVEYYSQAIKYKKDFVHGFYNLGCAYIELGEYNKARKNFESAIKLNPSEPDYYYNLGYAYKKLNHTKRAEKAIILYNELIQQRNEV